MVSREAVGWLWRWHEHCKLQPVCVTAALSEAAAAAPLWLSLKWCVKRLLWHPQRKSWPSSGLPGAPAQCGREKWYATRREEDSEGERRMQTALCVRSNFGEYSEQKRRRNSDIPINIWKSESLEKENSLRTNCSTGADNAQPSRLLSSLYVSVNFFPSMTCENGTRVSLCTLPLCCRPISEDILSTIVSFLLLNVPCIALSLSSVSLVSIMLVSIAMTPLLPHSLLPGRRSWDDVLLKNFSPFHFFFKSGIILRKALIVLDCFSLRIQQRHV